mgnify:CR=1 FL=1
MTLALTHYLVLAALLFSISIAGIIINRKNLIILLMSIELMLLSVNLNFIAFSHYLDDLAGQVFVFFILTVAAAEAAMPGFSPATGKMASTQVFLLSPHRASRRRRSWSTISSREP